MKVLVIGDSCTDKFIYGDCDRLCPEAPVPVFSPVRYTINGGMSANVRTNIVSMGFDCDLITNMNKMMKIRYVDVRTNQMIMRLDENDVISTDDKYVYAPDKLDGYDVIIISDYDKGFLVGEDISLISNHGLVFLQTNKIIDPTWSSNVDFIKINEYEYEHTKHTIEGISNLIVTLGENGCRYNGKQYSIEDVVGVRDLSGAGDTFLAALATEYVVSQNMEDAILYAQHCAMKVVQQMGVVAYGTV